MMTTKCGYREDHLTPGQKGEAFLLKRSLSILLQTILNRLHAALDNSEACIAEQRTEAPNIENLGNR